MKQERKVLGILAIIFGAIALLGSWMPIINNFSFILAILALIFGLIGFAVNRKRPKTLAIIGTVLAVVSIAIVLVTQAMYAKSLKELGKNVEETVSSVSSSIESSQKEEDAKFNWTKEQFDALQVGDIINYGAGGTNYDDVASVHGEPNNVTTSSVNDHDSKTVSYTSTGSKYKSVILSFSKQDDGSFLLTSKISSGLE
ncbi:MULTISPECIES: CD20-like domain-containing protein [unclassified Streptococcus]|uniref:CD20-like domain-containing protein n=1 Tax=unclassified Streptococcus TaxID=2608887 RepID=UPI001564F067|nr:MULTISPECIES: CD20-like domain-containing protein [unclassified Streptococcus]